MVAIYSWADQYKTINPSGPLGHIVCQPFEVVQDFVEPVDRVTFLPLT